MKRRKLFSKVKKNIAFREKLQFGLTVVTLGKIYFDERIKAHICAKK